MRIAFISYEFPPDTADGGIATYTAHASHVLCARGHDVEVFAGSRTRDASVKEHGVLVHRRNVPDPSGFAPVVAPLFEARHRNRPFDVLEGPDFMADASDAVRRVPNIPLVVRLHCPGCWIWRVEAAFPADPAPMSAADRDADPEYRHVVDADEWVAPSGSMADRLARFWTLPRERFVVIPNLYIPEPASLAIAVHSSHRVVTFLGRIDAIKGAHVFAAAIPEVAARHPDVRFRFVGSMGGSPTSGTGVQEYLAAMLGPVVSRVEFAGPVAHHDVPRVMAATDICVIPSLWGENFPYVCLEAMAAARGIVGSDTGGMVEMLGRGVAGELARPEPQPFAEALSRLLSDVAHRTALGEQARRRVLSDYDPVTVAVAQEASYGRAIGRRRAAGARRVHLAGARA